MKAKIVKSSEEEFLFLKEETNKSSVIKVFEYREAM